MRRIFGVLLLAASSFLSPSPLGRRDDIAVEDIGPPDLARELRNQPRAWRAAGGAGQSYSPGTRQRKRRRDARRRGRGRRRGR